MKKLGVPILLIILLASFMTVTVNLKTAKATSTISVPDDYPTIQSAIDHASDGDTIYIKEGVYYEHLNVQKSISLIGEDAEKTIVDGNETGSDLNAYQGYEEGIITIENLTFQNAGIEGYGLVLEGFSGVFNGNVVRNCTLGLFWDASGHTILIEDNTFLGNYLGMQFYMIDSTVTARNNRFIGNRYSLCLDYIEGGSLSLDTSNTVDGYAMYYFDGIDNQTIDENTCPSAGYLCITGSNNVTIQNITVLGKDYAALMLDNINNFTVTNVTTRASYSGIQVTDSYNGTLANNTFDQNSVGLSLDHSEYVDVCGNIFQNNTESIAINEDTAEEFLTNEIDTSNSVNGGTTYYLKNMNNVTLDDYTIPNAGFLGIVNSSNLSVKDLSSIPSLAVNVAFSDSITIANITAGSLDLYNVSDSEISSNKLIGGQNNDVFGIYGFYVQNLTLDNNYIWEFDIGIFLSRSSDILVTGNTIGDSIEYGITSDFVGTVYHNNFIDNNQAVMNGPRARYIMWDDGYPSGGNYWSDEVRTDVDQGPYQNETGSDGIADMPYVTFNGTEYGENSTLDRYPLTGPWTIKGENVTVTPSNTVAITFGNTTSEGITVVNTNSSGPDPPSGFKLESPSPEYYEINTTANYDGPITVGISYNDSGMTLEEENGLRLMHWNATDSTWTDITTSVDTTNNVVYGEAEHLSTFVVVWTVPRVDMRVVKVESKSVVGRGYVLSANLTVENQGYLETIFNASLYVNDNAVNVTSGIDLQGGIIAPIYLSWNTTGVGYGNYTLTACIPPCLNETDLADNNCTCAFLVHVGVPGDVSGTTLGVYDGITNMRDIAYLVSLFNTRPSSSNWNPNADVNNDGVCNMKDIAIAVLHFNQHE